MHLMLQLLVIKSTSNKKKYKQGQICLIKTHLMSSELLTCGATDKLKGVSSLFLTPRDIVLPREEDDNDNTEPYDHLV